ncbi:MAG TPA: HDIG domain-containing protein [Lutibacter sp.]|nr:HDIG domain-containing protein [Lutibacter sp.]
MKSILNKIFENHSLIYKVLLYFLSVFVIVYLFPKGGQFKYQFQKGKEWHYDDFVAPFDFAIQKTENEIKEEKEVINKNKELYFSKDVSKTKQVLIDFENKFSETFEKVDLLEEEKSDLSIKAKGYLKKTLNVGYVAHSNSFVLKDVSEIVSLKKGSEVIQVPYSSFLTDATKLKSISEYFETQPNSSNKDKTIQLINSILVYNVHYDKEFTDKALEQQLNAILPNKGFIPKNSMIIAQGEIVEGEKYAQLQSIAKEYKSKIWSKSNYYWLITAYSFLVALALIMLMLFIKKYRPSIYENTSKISFVFLNVVLTVLFTTLLLKFDSHYLYVLPFVILPIVIKAFFDARLGLFTYVLTILLLGFIVPNSFEFIFIQIIAGIVTILRVSELSKRASLFISVAQITGVYLLTYFAFSITKEGNISTIDWQNIVMFLINGMITASVVIPLIFLYEKMFGLVSDESLREYSDSNNKLLRELNEKAPGTFQHSIQVANLAEAAAKEINANALLVRAGALYHDIGKMLNPMYFTENQATSVNPHNELPPEDSAKIIIDHVIKGIELARKNKLPDRLIDFIRTHHGTSLVYYFYKQEEELNPDQVDKEKFRYPGPIPFSKETAILMMCDAAEAASKSLKEPTALLIDQLIDKVILGQMENGQFQNADITFREIEKIKKVIKKKLNNIYHVRIEYPE